MYTVQFVEHNYRASTQPIFNKECVCVCVWRGGAALLIGSGTVCVYYYSLSAFVNTL